MRRTSVIITAAVMLLCGCSEQLDLGEAVFNDVNSFDGVTLTIDHTTVSNIGAKFEILNTTDYEVCSGKPYLVALQVEKNDQWHNLKPKRDNRDTTSEAYIYYKNEPQIAEANWEADDGELPEGHYRIVKGFFISDENKSENFILADDFSISE